MRQIILLFFAAPALLLFGSDVFAQSRTAGQMVVPIGFENQDSIRFSANSMEAASNDGNAVSQRPSVDSLADEAGVKPGDAKFLYFQPGIAIDIAKNADASDGTTRRA